ncbi:SRPBCC family protein [Flavobacterium selenitireducens]|uniref:SRPBCC family protein n=1 Tax=Flavobacterium selenitireducens TaxID=2722704 RepID=UPI00168B7E24|nr:SRPBCC family protein [Flavobacterium selenitireducens]MBD3582811.1 polyketide cyclase [Flavobacterium selenitireducens]
METANQAVTIKANVKAPIEKVWKYWNDPEHVVKWNNASDDWHTPKAQNDLTVGGKFIYTMAAKDGSFSFDFAGTYSDVTPNKSLAYELEDGRKVTIAFEQDQAEVNIVETFEAENQNPIEMQRDGWQSILDNFKRYTENN